MGEHEGDGEGNDEGRRIDGGDKLAGPYIVRVEKGRGPRERAHHNAGAECGNKNKTKMIHRADI